MKEQVVFEIAGIVFCLSCCGVTDTLMLEQAYLDFLCTQEPEIIITVHQSGLPKTPLYEKDKIFDSQMLWSLYRLGGCKVFVLRSPIGSRQPYRLAICDEQFRRGDLYSPRPKSPDDPLPNPFEFPLPELLMICLLAQGRGLMVHACGIIDEGRGYLFAGNSTHGKTTMARLWREQATILNDDRIILRLRDGRFWMYGTPWHGEYDGVSPEGVPLDRVFFLRHAPDNEIRPVKGSAAVTGLLTRCFPPLWDSDGMRFTLDFCTKLAEEVSFFDLGFVPDKHVIDFVRCVR